MRAAQPDPAKSSSTGSSALMEMGKPSRAVQGWRARFDGGQTRRQQSVPILRENRDVRSCSSSGVAAGLGCVMQDGRSVCTFIQSMSAGGKHGSVTQTHTALQIGKQTHQHCWMERCALPCPALPFGSPLTRRYVQTMRPSPSPHRAEPKVSAPSVHAAYNCYKLMLPEDIYAIVPKVGIL